MKALPAELAALCRRMKIERGVALAVHEKPDPDALGAAAGMLDLFRQLGVEAELYVSPGEVLPLAAILAPSGARREQPAADLALYALDCGSQERIALPRPPTRVAVNIDHHHDNPRYGELAFVRSSASSTCELVCELARALGLTVTLPAATALYVGISFDSGHFHHDSTSSETFACAAWLRALGVDVTAAYAELYEQRSLPSLRLWGRAVAAAAPLADGRGLIATLGREDYLACGAGEDDTEGIAESLRGVGGVEVAAVVKEQTQGARVRVSLRSESLDVSAVAALCGGGGHRLAAGFSSDDSPQEVTTWLTSELERRLLTASC